MLKSRYAKFCTENIVLLKDSGLNICSLLFSVYTLLVLLEVF